MYLYAKLKGDYEISPKEEEDIYRSFYFKNGKKNELRDTDFVFLNFYDKNGKYLHQLYYMPNTSTFKREYHGEHY